MNDDLNKTTKAKSSEFPWKSQFMEWLKEIVPWEKIREYVQFKGGIPDFFIKGKMGPFNVDTRVEYDENCISVRVFSHDHLYNIVAKSDYLGCTMTKRKSRAGEDWTRGHDLPDGKFVQSTWDKIKLAILKTELVRVARPLDPKGIAASQAMTPEEMEGFERHHTRYTDKRGKEFYAEWLQRGEEIREHRVYELIGESSMGPKDNPGARWARGEMPGGKS